VRLLVVHHADAVSPAVDPQRPLSAEGRDQAARMADHARREGFVPAAIWHSGKLRARETAQPFLALNPFAPFKMVRGLLPDDPPDIIRDTLEAEDRDLIVVGHMPSVPAIVEALAGRVAPVALHGIVCLERVAGLDGRSWHERWRAAP